MISLGQILSERDSVNNDEGEALKWFRMADAVLSNSAESMFKIAIMLVHGDGVPKDEVQAVKWYRMAADRGYAGAMHNLGLMYSMGAGVPKDDTEAVAWYLKAWQSGFTVEFTATSLAMIYGKNESLMANIVEAHPWWNVAGALGSKDSMQARAELEKKMIREQIADATKLAKERFEKINPR